MRLRNGTYGALRSLTMHRLGATPGWTSFYADTARSGGAMVDLHIHDLDFIVAALGVPRAVRCAGTAHHLTTLLGYDDVPHVVAEGGWGHAPGFGFAMRYVAASTARRSISTSTARQPCDWRPATSDARRTPRAQRVRPGDPPPAAVHPGGPHDG